MIAKAEEIEALELFFKTVQLPKELKVNKAVTYMDLPKFVQENLIKIKTGALPDVVGKVRYDDLLEIKAMLSGQ
jgi:hypothetical protein